MLESKESSHPQTQCPHVVNCAVAIRGDNASARI